jgi:glycosyltransferase involved in cell wall biosynthesis
MARFSAARPAVSFIAWSSVSGRSEEIAAALQGDSRCFYDFGFVDKRLIPLRYLASAARTAFYLLRRRPRAVIVSNPPIFPALIAYLYCRLSGARIVLDSHPVSFGFDEEKKVVTLMMPLQRYLTPRVDGTIVTVESLAEKVREQGGRAAIVHEAPPTWSAPQAPPLGERPRVLFVGIFAHDEPAHAVAAAARELPEADILITGDLRKCPPELLEDPAPNIRFVGFLDQAAYREEIVRANVVMTLTDRPEDVSRVANEAVFARRPLIVSDWPAARRYFPHAIAVANTPAAVASGVREAIARYGELVETADAARDEQQGRWREQLDALRGFVAPG